MKKQTRRIYISILLVVTLSLLIYFVAPYIKPSFQTSLPSAIPNNYFPQSLTTTVTSGSTTCHPNADNNIECICGQGYSGSFGVWTGYSPISYDYNNGCFPSDRCSTSQGYGYTFPSDFNLQKNLIVGGDNNGFYEVADKNIVTISIPPNVNLFEKVINVFNVTLTSKQDVPVHLMAYLHRKNTPLYFDLSTDAFLKTGDNVIQFTIPSEEIYLTSDPYEFVLIPTFLHPMTRHVNANTQSGSNCGGSDVTLYKYIQLGNIATKTFVISSLPPYRYLKTGDICPQYYVPSVDSKNLCISIIPARGCGLYENGALIGCPTLFDPIQNKDVPMLCLADGRCSLPVGSGATLDPMFKNTLATLTKNENDFSLPQIPLRQLDINSPEIVWSKVVGVEIQGTTSCLSPLQETSSKGINIYFGDTLYTTFPQPVCSGTVDTGFKTDEIVPFDFKIKVDGSLIQKGVRVDNLNGIATATKISVLQQEDCIQSLDCQNSVISVLNLQANAECINYKCLVNGKEVAPPSQNLNYILWIILGIVIIIIIGIIIYIVKKRK